MITCACYGRGWACRIHRRPVCRSSVRPCRRWSTGLWLCPRGPVSICWHPSCAAAKVSTARSLPICKSAGFSGSRSTARCSNSTRSAASTKTSNTTFRSLSTASSCRPILATGLPIHSRPRSTWPTASPLPKTPIAAKRRFFRPNSPARFRVLRSPRSSRGCFLSTTRLAHARPATGSAPSSISIPLSSSMTKPAAWPRLRSARGRIPPRNITRRPWRASPSTSAKACTRRGVICRKRCGARSCTGRPASRSR